MPKRKRLKKTGKPMPSGGVKLERYCKFERELPTKSGVKVRSKLEQESVKFFEEHGIRFQYEPLLLLGGRKFRPDFFLPDYNLFFEICGYNHMPYYRDRQKEKEKAYKKGGMKVLFINCGKGDNLTKLLEENLPGLSD